MDDKQRIFAKAAGFAVPVVLILIDLMPATKARYSAPLIPIAMLAVGLVIPKIAMDAKWKITIEKSVGILFTTLLALSLLFLAAFLLFKYAAFDFADQAKFLPYITVLKSMSFIPPLCSVALAILAFQLFGKLNEGADGFHSVVLSATLAMVVGVNLFFVFAYPLSKVFRHSARETAERIDAFTPDGGVVCGVGYVGEEPFVAHLKKRWIMVDNLGNLSTPVDVLILSEDALKKLKAYEQRCGSREVKRKSIVYKKDHFYHIVALEKGTKANPSKKGGRIEMKDRRPHLE